MNVIALHGFSGVGKDTLADLLVRDHGYEKLAFADRLKQFLYEQDPPFDWTTLPLSVLVDEMGWDKAKRSLREVRELLQRTGEAAKKVLGRDVWIWPVLEQARAYERVVISDMRFRNEYDVLRHAAPRPGAFTSVRLWRDDVTPVNDHVSEGIPLPYDKLVDLTRVTLEEMPALAGVLADYADMRSRT